MAELEIRQVAGEAMVAAMYPLTNYAFRASPPFPDREEWGEMVRHREGVTCFAAFDGDTSVACAESTAMTQNVRGALLKMGGIWGVATHPAARRRGICRELLSRLLSAMHEAGEAVSGLYPFRESFYERLGYVTFPQWREATFSPLALAPLLKLDLDGEVELALVGDGLDAYYEVTAEAQRGAHGMALITAHGMVPSSTDKAWIAVARSHGVPVGLLLYTLAGEHVADFTMRVARFVTLSSLGRYLLLQWIARHVDQASSVEVKLGPHDRIETWLSDLKPHVATEPIAPMGRVVDVAGLGGLRVGEGGLRVRVRDAQCPWNEGAWRLEGADGALQVTRLVESAIVDGELSIQALSALVYGTHDPGDFAFRGWATLSEASISILRRVFPPMLPHMYTRF